MSISRRTIGISTVSATLLVIGVLVVLNLVSTRIFGRADLTEGNIYSLSAASREVASNLEDPLTARVYISDDLPPSLVAVRQYLVDLLAEYRAYGKGNFQFEVVKPNTAELESEAQGYGIPPRQENVFRQDKVELMKVYLGLVFIHADRQEAIPAITRTEGLEYDLTSAIRRVTRQSLGSIGVLVNPQGPTLEAGLSRLREAVGQEYRIRAVDLTTGPVPSDVTVMAVIGPKSNFSDTVLYRLDQYVMRGGPVLFLLNGAEVNMQGSPQQGGGIAFASRSNADSLAGYYGAAPDSVLVVDARHLQIRAMQSLGFIQLPVLIEYPYFVAASGTKTEHLLGKDLERLDLLFTSPLKLKPQPGATLTVLARSSEKSGVRTLPAMVMPPVEIADADYNAPGQALVAAIEGTLESYFTDTVHVAPAGFGSAADPDFRPRSLDVRIVVVGDADLATDQAMSPINQVFVLNAFDWLSRNDLLIALRSREVQNRPLDTLDPGARSRIKWANLFGPSLLVVLFGLVRWRRRAASKRNA
jgi:gliding-associated putative ABC transporter substrate-binding component GldG